MRFSYVAVGAAGFLTSTMVDGRVVPAGESTLRSTALHARSSSYISQQATGKIPYNNQISATPVPSTGRVTSDKLMSPNVVSATETKPVASNDKQTGTTDYHPTASPAKTDATPITSVTRPLSSDKSTSITAAKNVAAGTSASPSPSYTSGQIVGFKAGLNIRTSTSTSQAVVPPNILTQDATFNQGVHAGFEAGHAAQIASPSGSPSAAYTQGQLAGFQTAVAQHQQAGFNIEKSMSSILNGSPDFNSGVKSGFQVGISVSANAKQSVQVPSVDAIARSSVGGSTQTAVGVEHDTHFLAGQQAGIQAGVRAAQSGQTSVGTGASSLFGANKNFNAGVQAGFEVGFAQHAQIGVAHQAGSSGVQAASSVQAGAHVKSDVGLTASKQVGIQAGQSGSAGVGGSVEKSTTSQH